MLQLLTNYKGLLDKNGIKNKVPVLTAEDETAIKAVVTYSQQSDELNGFCGLNTENPNDHRFFEDVQLVAGNDKDSYSRM